MWEWKSNCLNSCKIHPEYIIPVKWEHNDCAVLWSTEMIQSKRANSFGLARDHLLLGKEIDFIGKKLEIRVIFLNLFLTSWKRPGLLEGSNELTGEFDDPCPHPVLQIQDVPNSVWWIIFCILATCIWAASTLFLDGDTWNQLRHNLKKKIAVVFFSLYEMKFGFR